MELKAEKIEFIAAPGNPSKLLTSIKDLWTPENRKKVFHGGIKPDLVSFCYELVGYPAFLTKVDGNVVGLFWLTNTRDLSAEISFIANPGKYKLDYLKVGKEFINFLKKSGKTFTFYGFIVETNQKALNFALKIGFKKGMVFENAAKDLKGGLCGLSIVYYQTKGE